MSTGGDSDLSDEEISGYMKALGWYRQFHEIVLMFAISQHKNRSSSLSNCDSVSSQLSNSFTSSIYF